MAEASIAPSKRSAFRQLSILCQEIVAPGGVIANIGVHGVKADLHLEKLWDRNITITTRLVDTVTTPMLLKTVQAKEIDPKQLITHRFTLDKILDAYDTFGTRGGYACA